MEFSLKRLIGRFSLFFSAILFTALNFNDAFAQGAGKALEFNGTNQSVSIPHASSLDVTSAMTLEAWMKTTGENWNYKVPISFNPATPEADYQVKVELTSSNFAYAHAKSDGSDIRFYDGNGTELNYWIEKWDASGTSIIWVKVPTAGTTEIFMYYGNPSAQAASNATNTFVRVINGNSPLKGSWHFDEGSGTTAYDNSGNGNNGTLYNSPAWVDGKFGKALSFDGSNDYLQTPIISNTLTDFTMEAWVKASSVPDDRRIVMGSGWNYNDWYIGINLSSNTGAPAKKWLFWVAGNSQIAYLAAPDEIVAGAWYYLVATYEGTTGKFYINGNYIGSFTFTRKTDTNPFQIGRSYNGEYFNGLVDEVRVYNRALTSEEVSDLYQNYGYTTTNASGKVLVRKYSATEPASTVGSEISMADIMGISKVDAYGIGVNSTAAFASINNQTISGEISSGWNHIAQTYDGSIQKLYLNGFLVVSQPLSGEITANANDLLIGNMFNGTIDEVRLWNVARTEEEIRANMCKKLNGNETGLVGYWRLDEGSGTTTNDATSNSNNGTLVNSPSWVWSGAAIGDESAYDYDGTNPEDFTVNLAHSAGDDITATGDGGTVKGIQVYRVDANSMRDGSTKPDDSWTMDPLRYWGVFITGTNPTYKLIYNYSGHPDITDASDLNLAKRDNLSDNSWDDANATLITEAGTLTLTGQNGGEYALGSKTGANPLPVELTSFTASIADNAVSLKWHTATEVDNHGFEIERRGGESEEWIMVGFVEGKGTSNAPREYSYQDTKLGVGKYEYRLKQIDNSGAFKYTGSVEVEVSAPKEYALHQNYPNPFNPVTKISYEIPVKSLVTLKVYDMLGREVARLYDGEREAGRYEAEFNGMRFSSGVYFYKLEAGSYKAVKKLLLVK